MKTLREHLEAIRDRHSPEPDSEDTWCQLCAGPYRGVPHPCPDHEHAAAALAILDAAKQEQYRLRISPHYATVPDPEPSA